MHVRFLLNRVARHLPFLFAQPHPREASLGDLLHFPFELLHIFHCPLRLSLFLVRSSNVLLHMALLIALFPATVALPVLTTDHW